MTCPDCKALRELVAEYETALDGAIWPKDFEAKRIAARLKITLQQAHLVHALYQAVPGLTTHQISQFLPAIYGDQESRDPSYGSVIIHNVRAKLGAGFIEGIRSSRANRQVYALGSFSRGVVTAILSAA
jgi:hypothetical protein